MTNHNEDNSRPKPQHDKLGHFMHPKNTTEPVTQAESISQNQSLWDRFKAFMTRIWAFIIN